MFWLTRLSYKLFMKWQQVSPNSKSQRISFRSLALGTGRGKEAITAQNNKPLQIIACGAHKRIMKNAGNVLEAVKCSMYVFAGAQSFTVKLYHAQVKREARIAKC